MSMLDKYKKKVNGERKFKFDLPKEFQYVKLMDLYSANGENHVYKINALYINTKSKFGKSFVIATDNELVNLPMFMTNDFDDLYHDSEFCELVNNGVVGFIIYEYENNNGINYSIRLEDYPSK